MENASKALIIAGAILLSIAIIGIGMYVYNMAQGTIQSANMNQQEITAYNAEFLKYEGNVTGTTAKTLCDVVRNHNAANNGEDGKIIVLNNNSTSIATTAATDSGTNSSKDLTKQTANISTLKENIKTGNNYKISFGYSTTGLIKFINIQSR